MKLYSHRQAPNPFRVTLFLAEKGVKVDTTYVDFMHGELQADAFKAINEFQKIPVFVLDDGTAICESAAICRYIEEMNPLKPLHGQTAKERAMIEMWNRRADLQLLYQIAQVFRHTNPAMAKLEQPQVSEWGEANRPKALETLAIFDAQLSKNPFIAGDRYSVADITTFTAINFGRVIKLQVPEELGNLRRWYAKMIERPAVQSALQVMKETSSA
ncbi:Glutathione S-transferase GST-6.0 [Pseudovibrio axinellae]|uniref:Glutathione S-transferase GST-6.0 n=1 Tax=Pseudovibrio axinellae TaxID=989403 RepID=A0A165TZ77_9HYPH|nr:glutathione S-transferase [Pseudovibrio axinellae]KZL08504.1 Glutathione S-transferase GST-6.0 [Pseudovibrio axinellae]SEP76557.1 Glutathione S-transferase [Pseudovibrio axinellae]